MRHLLQTATMSILLAAPLSAASVDGVKIHSEVVGTGKATLVFVHGWTCDSTSWVEQVPTFAKSYRVITLDLPGHGQSGSPADGRFSMELFARAVEAVREEAKADRMVLIGHSMGAPVIRQYAIRYPERVAALVAVDGPLDLGSWLKNIPAAPQVGGPDGVKVRESMIRSMFTPETDAELQTRILTMMLKAPEATAVGAMAAIFDPAIRGGEVVSMPALAIYAGTAPVPDPAEMRKRSPRYEATQLAGTGHFLMMERPAEFNKLLKAFLDRIKY